MLLIVFFKLFYLFLFNLYESTSIAIIGNKLDLESENKREISYEEGKKFSEEKKNGFF